MKPVINVSNWKHYPCLDMCVIVLLFSICLLHFGVFKCILIVCTNLSLSHLNRLRYMITISVTWLKLLLNVILLHVTELLSAVAFTSITFILLQTHLSCGRAILIFIDKLVRTFELSRHYPIRIRLLCTGDKERGYNLSISWGCISHSLKICSLKFVFLNGSYICNNTCPKMF